MKEKMSHVLHKHYRVTLDADDIEAALRDFIADNSRYTIPFDADCKILITDRAQIPTADVHYVAAWTVIMRGGAPEDEPEA